MPRHSTLRKHHKALHYSKVAEANERLRWRLDADFAQRFVTGSIKAGDLR